MSRTKNVRLSRQPKNERKEKDNRGKKKVSNIEHVYTSHKRKVSEEPMKRIKRRSIMCYSKSKPNSARSFMISSGQSSKREDLRFE